MSKRLFHKKIKAFTLPEAMVTLVLSILIISLAYFAYNYMLKSFIKYREINEHIGDHCRATIYLESELAGCEEIIKTRDGLAFRRGGKDIKTLHLAPQYLVFGMPDGKTDTLRLDIKSFSLVWKNDSLLKDKSPVQEIKFELNFSGTIHKLIFEKPYDSEERIKLDSLYNSLQ